MASQNTSSLISSVYKSRSIILELMKMQGYDVSEYDGFSVNEVNTMKTNNQLDMMLEKLEEDEDTKRKNKIYIRYYLAKSLRPQNLQEMIDDLFNIEEVLKKTDTLFIVVKDEVNETLLNLLKHIWEQDKIFIVIQKNTVY
jgi:5'-deoxynucleotidase YfbR-like HD superfamily hydrolase